LVRYLFANPNNFKKIGNTKHVNSKHGGRLCQGKEKEEKPAWSREHRAESEDHMTIPGLPYSLLYALRSMRSKGLSSEAFEGIDVSFSGL
jgi:hypothetical protein